MRYAVLLTNEAAKPLWMQSGLRSVTCSCLGWLTVQQQLVVRSQRLFGGLDIDQL